MFGYVIPQRGELKVRELSRYEAYYCGLCRTIGARYGQAARLALNYDCAFFALVLSSLVGGGVCEKGKCAYKPLRKARPMVANNEALAFSADLNVALAYNKLCDDGRDEKGLGALSASIKRGLFSPSYRASRALNPGLCAAIEDGIDALCALENATCDELDAPPDAFGKLLADCAALSPVKDAGKRTAFRAMAYELGRWIYLADAWADRERDAQTGGYNAFNAAGADRERAEFLLWRCLNGAIDAYWLLGPVADGQIIENILIDGCGMKTRLLLGGNDGKSI